MWQGKGENFIEVSRPSDREGRQGDSAASRGAPFGGSSEDLPPIAFEQNRNRAKPKAYAPNQKRIKDRAFFTTGPTIEPIARRRPRHGIGQRNGKYFQYQKKRHGDVQRSEVFWIILEGLDGVDRPIGGSLREVKPR